MEWIKRNWKMLVKVIAGIVGFIFLRQYFQKDLLAKLKNQQVKAKDDVLNEKRSQNKQSQEAEQATQERLREQLDKPAPNSNWQEVEDFYKNRK